MLTLSKKRQRTGTAPNLSPPKVVANDSDSETSDSDDDWGASGKKKKPKKKKAKLSTGKSTKKASSGNESHSDPEEGKQATNFHLQEYVVTFFPYPYQVKFQIILIQTMGPARVVTPVATPVQNLRKNLMMAMMKT